jgi:hypothetical protein
MSIVTGTLYSITTTSVGVTLEMVNLTIISQQLTTQTIVYQGP